MPKEMFMSVRFVTKEIHAYLDYPRCYSTVCFAIRAWPWPV